MNKKDEQDNKEPDVIGHERFYQARSRSVKKKKRVTRRTHSAAEFPSSTLTAASKRAAFKNRSHSSENKSDDGGKSTPQRVDSIAKLFFGKR